MAAELIRYQPDTRPFPTLLEVRNIQRENSSFTLSQLLSMRQENHWRQVAYMAETLILHQSQGVEDKILSNLSLSVRALDKGMINLSLEQKIAFLYRYATSQLTIQDHVDDLFPFAESTKVSINEIFSSPKQSVRFDRFLSYMQRLTQMHNNGRADILLADKGDSERKGIYTEFDFCVEQDALRRIQSGRRVMAKDVAASLPADVTEGLNADVIYEVGLSLRRLERFGLPTGRTTSALQRRAERLRPYIINTAHGPTLSKKIDEIAAELGLTYQETWRAVERLKKNGEDILVPKGPKQEPKPETIVLAHHIVRAVNALNKPGKRWEFAQISYKDIIAYIEATTPPIELDKLGKITVDMVETVVNDYMTAPEEESPNIPHLPARDYASVRRAKRMAIQALIEQGITDIDQIAAILQLSPMDTAPQRRHARAMVRELLNNTGGSTEEN